MATGATAATATQLAGGLTSSLSDSPTATSGDAKGGTTGDFSFGNINFGGTQSNSTSSGLAPWIIGGAVVIAGLYFIFRD